MTNHEEVAESRGIHASTGSWRSAPFDAIVIVSLLGIANWFIARDDLGWFSKNPTPWLLLPFFLGGRYGLVLGLLGSGLAASAVLSMNRFATGQDAIELLTREPYYFFSILLTGALASLIHSLVAGPVRQIINRNRFLESKTRNLKRDLALYRENESALQQSLLLHGAETVSLTSELHRVFMQPRAAIDDGLLEIFQRLCGVESASIYRRVTTDGPFHPTASLGASLQDTQFPETISEYASELPLAAMALERQQIVTCRHLWATLDERTPPEQADPFIAALPSANGFELLLISRMSFDQVTWESFARVETLFHWVMMHQKDTPVVESEETATTSPILAPDDFIERIILAKKVAEHLGLESRIILFSPTPSASSASQKVFVQALQASTTIGDTIGAIRTGGGENYAVALLTPLVSEAAARSRAESILSGMTQDRDAIRYHIVDPTIPSALSELEVTRDRHTPEPPSAQPESDPTPASR